MKGSPSNYTNVVTACIKCNAIKADRLLSECKMKLLKEPKPVTYQQSFINELMLNDVDKSWWVSLQGFIKKYDNQEKTQEK